MVVLPEDFVASRRYPGYFWSVQEKRLYSIKSGILKPIKLHKGYAPMSVEPGYSISHLGVRHRIPLSSLMRLRIPENPQVIKVLRYHG